MNTNIHSFQIIIHVIYMASSFQVIDKTDLKKVKDNLLTKESF